MDNFRDARQEDTALFDAQIFPQQQEEGKGSLNRPKEERQSNDTSLSWRRVPSDNMELSERCGRKEVEKGIGLSRIFSNMDNRNQVLDRKDDGFRSTSTDYTSADPQ